MQSAQRKASDVRILSDAERILSQVRPFLKSEGGDVKTRDFQDGILTLEVSGACVGCALASTDFADLSDMLKQSIPEIKDIVYRNQSGLPIF